MASNSVSSLLSSQFALYQYSGDMALQAIKNAQAERYNQTVKTIQDKYTGRPEAEAEEALQKAVDRKAVMAKGLNQVDSALDDIDYIRNKLLEMRAAAKIGSADAFDLAYSTLTSKVGSTWSEPDNLEGNNRTGKLTWPDKTTTISSGIYSAQLTHYFLGNDYAITLEDGSVLRPNASEETLDGSSDGQIGFGDVANASITTDADTGEETISFEANGETYSGKLTRGGGGVMHSWAYNGFAGDDAEAQKTSAMADIDTALERVSKAERSWLLSKSQLEANTDKLNNVQEQAKADFEKVSKEQNDAKTAEIKAAKARYELSVNTLALTQGQASNFISQMFMTSGTYSKPSLFEILRGETSS